MAEREAVARTLRRAVHDAQAGGAPLLSRVPVHPNNIRAAEDLIDAITLRLHSPRPVSSRGVARLRVVLADGAGPMYRYGRGDLGGEARRGTRGALDHSTAAPAMRPALRSGAPRRHGPSGYSGVVTAM